MMEAEVEPPEATEREKSVPVPESATECGLPEASSVMVRVPDRLPVAVGAKEMLKVQLATGTTVLPQVLD